VTEGAADRRRGLLLPPGVIQPFFLRFTREDWHVMAFIEGHPAYEAVEAMVREKPEGGWAIRAIITRHDQSQMDHLNEAELSAGMRGALREVFARNIDFTLDLTPTQPRARLAFMSGDDEPVVLSLTALGPPDPAGAGLSDPGGHSAVSSLPLMWRGASTLAADDTWVEIAGRRYEAPVRVLGPGRTAREGYLTRGHHMGVIRAGEVRLTPLRAPAALAPGGEWAFESDWREVVYRITGEARDGALAIERRGPLREVITARPVGERLELLAVAAPDADGLALSFAGDRFELAIDRQPLVTGRVASDGASITLAPDTPDWATRRPVRVQIAQADGATTFVTAVG
jgi:hypothetical protein